MASAGPNGIRVPAGPVRDVSPEPEETRRNAHAQTLECYQRAGKWRVGAVSNPSPCAGQNRRGVANGRVVR